MKKIVYVAIALTGLFTTMSCASSTEANSDANSTQQTGGGVVNIKASDFEKTVKDQQAVVIDVRTPEETAAGVIEGVDLLIDYKSSNFGAEVAKLDKSKAYVIYCRSGGRSAAASQYMIDNGFKKVYNLEGGIMGWTEKVVAP